MEEGRWEDVTADCLINIFRRLDLESRVLYIPFVCKTWYQAVQDQLCWQKLDFPDHGSRLWQRVRYSDRIKLVKFVVNLSQRCATSLVIWNYCTREELMFVSEECPALNTLVLPTYICCDSADIILSFIGKWKNLEFLSLKRGYINEDQVSTIVSLLPKLMYLTINQATLGKKNLLLILKGCKELVLLDVCNCIGFDEDDEEILKLSSIIKNFQCNGSTSGDPLCKKRKNSMKS